jgi:hypothetical protein
MIEIEGAAAGIFARLYQGIGEWRLLIEALEAQVAFEQRKNTLIEAELRRLQSMVDDDHFQAWMDERFPHLRRGPDTHQP